MANPYLEVEAGAEAKRYEMEIGVDDVVVGRSTDCHWVISSGAVSRRHARILRQGGEITIEDLGSSNGTFVNGERLSEPKVLQQGQAAVRFGSVEAHFFVPAATPESDATVSIADLQPTMLAGGKLEAHSAAPAPAPDTSSSPGVPDTPPTGTSTSSRPTRVEAAPSETAFRPAPAAVVPTLQRTSATARGVDSGGGKPSFVELAVIAAASFIVVFGVGAVLVRFVF